MYICHIDLSLGMVQKISSHHICLSPLQNYMLRPKKKRDVSEEKQAISEKLENLIQLIAHTLTSDTLTEKFHANSNEYENSKAATGLRGKEHQQKPGSYTAGAEWASHFKIMPLFIQYIFIEPLPSARHPRYSLGIQ